MAQTPTEQALSFIGHLTITTLVLAAGASYVIGLLVYRLYFHPLRNIPGPLLARSTAWYEFYQDVILGGHYVKEYPKLHAKYGPVVRVSPDRVHVGDPEFFHVVYSSGSKFMKDAKFFQTSGGIAEALPALVNVDYHRIRRKMINPLFSAKSMDQLAPIVLQVVKNAIRKATQSHNEIKPLDMQRLYTGVTIDTIMKVLCDKQLNMIDAEEEEPAFMATLRTFSDNFFTIKHFPILGEIATNLPEFIMERLVPGDLQFRRTVNRWIDERSEAHKQGIDRAEDGRKTILDLLLQPEEGEKPLSKASVVDETYSFCFAGTHTTSFTMSLSTYYLLSNPDKLEKLRQEIQTVQPNDEGLLEFAALRTLPYLTAVIKESLRMSSPVPGVIPRCVPEGGMTWAGHFLPAGTSVSISIRTVHDDPEIFPQPEAFLPERWLNNDDLDHWLVVFGKGSRACIGLNVAWMELYLCLGNIFRRFDMDLFETNAETVQWDDCGNAMIRKHVKVMVNGLR